MTSNDWSDALLHPRSVALIGVSDDRGKTSGRPLHFLRSAGFAGTVFAINPSRVAVQGEAAFASLSDLPTVPDHVFILTGPDSALDSLEQCELLGVPVATILSSGFSEIGGVGEARQLRLEAIIARGRTRVVGPSSIGVVNLHNGLVLTANAAFAEADLPRGSIFVGSHSGSLIGALVSRGKRMGIGFAGLVSVGGETDLSMGEICASTLDDPGIGSYMLFLETLRHADALRDFAREAARRGKPVAAYKLGRSQIAAELAVSHTGALAGADEIADLFLRSSGIARVDAFEALIEVVPLLCRLGPAGTDGRGRVGVVTTTGGGAAMAVDRLALRGIEVVAPTLETRRRLVAAGVAAGEGRIVDLTLAGTRYAVMKSALDVMRAAPEFDLVLVTVGSSARFNPELAVQPIIDAAGEGGSPLAAFIVPDAPDAVRLLAGAGIPVFQHPETCADALSAAYSRRPPLASAGAPPLAPPGAIERLLDEAAAYDLLSELGIASAPIVILEPGQPPAALPFDYPVVAKVLDHRIAHKTDTGGVVLGISDAGELQEAIETITANVGKALPGIVVERVLVQPMCRGLAEMLVGFRRDPDIGPLVMLAAGGIHAELYRDACIRLAPVDLDGAGQMIAEVKASRLLYGYRRQPRGDLAALAAAIVTISRLALATDPWVLEAEINPLLILPDSEGVLAVDALVRIRTR